MVEHMECPRASLGKLVPEHFFFSPLRTPLPAPLLQASSPADDVTASDGASPYNKSLTQSPAGSSPEAVMVCSPQPLPAHHLHVGTPSPARGDGADGAAAVDGEHEAGGVVPDEEVR